MNIPAVELFVWLAVLILIRVFSRTDADDDADDDAADDAADDAHDNADDNVADNADDDESQKMLKDVENEFKDYIQPWSNFNNLTPMTDALSDFMGMPRGSLAARKDISDAVLAYVRDNGFSELMDTSVTLPLNKYTLVLFIKSHFSVHEKPSVQRDRHVLYPIRDALCDFLECPHGTRMSRSQLIHCIENYIRIEQIDLETDIEFVGPIEQEPGVPKFVTLMRKICEQHILTTTPCSPRSPCLTPLA